MITFRYIGISSEVFHKNSTDEEYKQWARDLLERRGRDIETTVMANLAEGIYPLGLVLLADEGGAGVVVADPVGGQRVEPFNGKVKVVV